MDIASHGLWGGIAFGRKNRKAFWSSFFFGVMPDLFSFGVFFFVRTFTHGFALSRPPLPDSIPEYIYLFYNVTHSLIIFIFVFSLVWLLRGRPFAPMLAWGLHILMDIFTHGREFFPTPFLWPVSDYTFDGIPWGHPAIWYPNLALLIGFYVWLYRTSIARKKEAAP